MIATLDRHMAKGPGGRPKKEDGDAGTRQIRVNNDIADMLGWIAYFEGVKVAQIIDPLIRKAVTAQYERYRPAVEKMKAAEAEAAARRQAEANAEWDRYAAWLMTTYGDTRSDMGRRKAWRATLAA